MFVVKRLVTILSLVGLLWARPVGAAVPKSPLTKTGYVQVKLRQIGPTNQLTSPAPPSADVMALGLVLQQYHAVLQGRLMRAPVPEISQQRQQIELSHTLAAGSLPDLNSYYRIKLPNATAADQLARQLQALPIVEAAYAEPPVAPAPITPDYTNLQLYFKPAPSGLGFSAMTGVNGGLGNYVSMADVEYAWNTAHEDLWVGSTHLTHLNNGTPVDPFNNTHHGTAVAGSLVGKRDVRGINGTVSDSKLYLVNSYNSEYGWDPVNAVYTATKKLVPGDVLVLEQQTYGPQNELLPVEWLPAVYDAVRLATQKGIIVVEAAANGGVNLDNYGTTFPSGKVDSGAILVGAGAACGTQADRSRLSYSNYGNRLNVQGRGECVVTTGYGDLFGPSLNRYYTRSFNGTSSATATVAGAVAALSSAYEAKTGHALTPAHARTALVTTGTAQNTAVTGKIGPLPNVPSALTTAVSVWP